MVSDTDTKITPVGAGAASFTTGLTAIIGAAEGRVVFDVPAIVASSLVGIPATDLHDAIPRVGRALGQAFESYLRSRPTGSWPRAGEPLLTAGLAWYDKDRRPSIAALTLSMRSSVQVDVSVDGQLWGPAELAQLIPLFFGRTEVAGAIASGTDEPWTGLRRDSLVTKILRPETKPSDVSVEEAQRYLRTMVKLTSEEGPRRLGLPATVGPSALCYLLEPNKAVGTLAEQRN